jgi:hypothetical protein
VGSGAGFGDCVWLGFLVDSGDGVGVCLGFFASGEGAGVSFGVPIGDGEAVSLLPADVFVGEGFGVPVLSIGSGDLDAAGVALVFGLFSAWGDFVSLGDAFGDGLG